MHTARDPKNKPTQAGHSSPSHTQTEGTPRVIARTSYPINAYGITSDSDRYQLTARTAWFQFAISASWHKTQIVIF